MMRPEFVPEDEVFGDENGWRLLLRTPVDGQQMVMRALPIQGRGVLLQQARKPADGPVVYEPPFMVDDVLMLETVIREDTGIVSPGGQPLTIRFKCIDRSLIGVRMAKERFQPKQSKHAPPGPHDHLEIRAGIVLTTEARMIPQQQPKEAGNGIAIAPGPENPVASIGPQG